MPSHLSITLRSAFLVLLAALIPGCLTIEQSLRFNNDSSLVAAYVYTYRLDDEDVIKAALQHINEKVHANDPAESIGLGFLDENAVKAFCRAQNIELRQFKKSQRNGLCTVQIILLARDAEKALNNGTFGAFNIKEVNSKKRCTAEFALDSSKWIPEDVNRIKKLCKGLSVTLNIIAPDKITKTNGKLTRNDSATWTFSLDGQDSNSLLNPPDSVFAEW